MNFTALAQRGRQFAGDALGLIYPSVCQICESERAEASAGFICQTCFARTRFIEPPFCERCGLPFAGEINISFECANCRELELHFDNARAAVTLDGPVQTALHRFKYGHAEWFEPFLARLLIERAAPELANQNWDFIAPVPLHPVKLREREFNQADRLAQRLAKATGIQHENKLLRRVKPTPTQTRLSRTERAENLRGAFAASAAGLKEARVVLVDDVLTTGATANAAAAALRKVGAAQVAVWTVARGTLRPVLACESAPNI
ncbi:MAG: ComF family protein [Pedosphaera sp.]|nr:ComF family protein [Pedosphaera sp.]